MGAGERLFHLIPPFASEGTPWRAAGLRAAAGRAGLLRCTGAFAVKAGGAGGASEAKRFFSVFC